MAKELSTDEADTGMSRDEVEAEPAAAAAAAAAGTENPPDDVLLTVDDVRAFFLSRSGRVKNTELIQHFRVELKKGRHRDANRQNMPNFINELAMVSKDETGGKVLTLRKQFRSGSIDSSGSGGEGRGGPTGNAANTKSAASGGDGAAAAAAVGGGGAGGRRKSKTKAKSSAAAPNDPVAGNDNNKSGISSKPDATDDKTNFPAAASVVADVDSSGELTQKDDPAEAAGEPIIEAESHPPGFPDNISAPTIVIQSPVTVESQSESSSPAAVSSRDPEDSSTPLESQDPAAKDNNNTGSVDSNNGEQTDGIMSVVMRMGGGILPLGAKKLHKAAAAAGGASSAAPRADTGDGGDEIREQRVHPLQAAKAGEATKSVRELAQKIEHSADDIYSTGLPSTGDRLSAIYHARKQSSGSKLSSSASSSRISQAADDYTMDATGLEWVVRSAMSDYQSMSKLLRERPSLARRRDFMTGFTALHWAAKNGRCNVIKLLMGSAETPSVDARSSGGYSALHVAATHARHEVIDLLVIVYKADIDLSDYSGHKPIFYLVRSASVEEDRQSNGYLRSEALLKSRRRPSKMLMPPPSSSVVERSQSTRRASMPIGYVDLSLGLLQTRRTPTRSDRRTPDQQSASPLLLPPRELPAVVQRRPVSSTRESGRQASTDKQSGDAGSAKESHSDPESSASGSGMKSCGSTPNFGTLV